MTIALLVATHLVALGVGAYLMRRWTLYVANNARKGAAVSEPKKRRRISLEGAAIIISCLALCVVGILGFIVQPEQRHNDQQAQQDATQHQLDNFRSCLNNYATLTHEAQTVRSTATAALQAASEQRVIRETRLWTLILKSLSGQVVSKQVGINALGRYLTAATHEQDVLKHLEAQRAAHPYPESPAVACPAPKGKP